MKKKILFISSTGGHLNELLQLEPMFKKYDYHIITEKDKSTISLKDKYDKNISYLNLFLIFLNLYFYLLKFVQNI